MADYLRWVEAECALHTGSDAWQDDSSIALEALSASIHHGDEAALVQFTIFILEQADLNTVPEVHVDCISNSELHT